MFLLKAQSGIFVNGANASLRVDSTSFLSVGGDFQNLNCDPVKQVRFNGPLILGGNLINNDSLKFSPAAGTGNSKKARISFVSNNSPLPTGSVVIGGTVPPKLWEVELNKGLGLSLTLFNNVSCLDTLEFKSGFLYLNGYKWNIVDPVGAPSVINHPYIKNERQGSQFLPTGLADTGQVVYTTIYNYSVDINPANLGIQFKGLLNTGSALTILRGAKVQVNSGKSSIQKYFDVYSPGHSLNTNTVTLRYHANDYMYLPLNYFTLANMGVFVSPNTDMNWTQLGSGFQGSLVNAPGPIANGSMTVNLSELMHPNTNINPRAFRLTIADPDCLNPPISGLTQDTLHICTGNSLLLDAGNNTSVFNTSLKWEWNAATLPVYTRTILVTPNTAYQKYTLSLKDVRGCVTKDSVIIAPQAPYPQINYLNHLNACLGDSVLIKDTVQISSGTFTNYWQFSDGSNSTSQSQLIKKKFLVAGSQSYQLTSTSVYGCSVTTSNTNVIVYPLPSASFIHAFNCASGSMSFSNTSVTNFTSSVISASLWYLGQGATNTSTLYSPSQTYSSSGTYSVKLLCTTSLGCKDSVSIPITISPTNNAIFSKNNSCLTDTVYFNNTSACNTGSCSYSWRFGDALQSGTLSPKKVYASAGLYVVWLKVNAPQACADSVSTTVFVNPNPNAQFSSTATDLCPNEFVYFTNTSGITSGSITTYAWNFANGTTTNSINGTITYTSAGIYNVSLTAISDSACSHTSIQSLTVHPTPLAQYTVNNACLGSPSQFISSSSGSGLQYVWNFGNSVQTGTVSNASPSYTYSAPGNYSTSLIVLNAWGCSDTANLTTSVLLSPVAALGNSVSTCGTSYTLNAGNAGASYYWLPGNQITQSIVVTSSGLYQVSITGTNSCIGTESVLVTLNSLVKPQLGNDTIVCGNYKLNAGYPGGTYLWNTGASSQSIVASTSGTFAVQVIDQNGCMGYDTIQLTVKSPAILSLGADLLICKPKYGYVLTATTNAVSYNWSNGQSTSSISINASGSYWLEVSHANGCKTKDTVLISFLITPQIELGSNRSVCGNTLLDAQNNGYTYLWNTGSTSQILNVNSSGDYWVRVTNPTTTCFQEDSINVKVNPLISVMLGNDTSICDNIHFVLNALNAGATYSWTNGQNTQTASISSSGIYGVTVTGAGGCSASDYISITVLNAPQLDLGKDLQYLCGNNTIDLSVTNTGTLVWHSSSGFTSSNHSISINSPAKYWLDVNERGCTASDSVLIQISSNTIQAMFLASTVDTINKPVQFVNLSTPTPSTQIWHFGDGLSSSESNPVHTFLLPQNFSVTLEVSNGFCSDKITKEINVMFRSKAGNLSGAITKLELLTYAVYPNPGINHVQVEFSLNEYAPVELSLYDLNGKVLYTQSAKESMYYSERIDLESLANGLYFLRLSATSSKGNISRISKIIKTD